LHSPSFLSEDSFAELLEQMRSGWMMLIDEEMVLTRSQYIELWEQCVECSNLEPPEERKEVVWLNSSRYDGPYWFSPQCENRGTISGTSLIPPVKAREILLKKKQGR